MEYFELTNNKVVLAEGVKAINFPVKRKFELTALEEARIERALKKAAILDTSNDIDEGDQYIHQKIHHWISNPSKRDLGLVLRHAYIGH